MPVPPDATLNPRARQEDYNSIYQQVLDEIDSESHGKDKGKKKKRKKPDNKLHNWQYYYERPKWKDFEPSSGLTDRLENAPPPPPRRFKDCTPGFLMLTLLREAHARGALVEIHANFSKERDSAGQPWSKKPKDLINHKFKPKTTLLQVANWLADANHAEARMNGRVLELYRPDSGKDHPDVLLAKGRNVTSLPKKGTHRDLATHVFVQSESGVHGWVGDEKLRKRIGRRVEAGLDTGYAKYWEIVEERGKNYLRRFGVPKHARTVTIVPDRGANPYKQYGIGDTVRLMENGIPTKHRVRQIMLRWETDGSCVPIVVLSHKLIHNAIKQHKKLRALTGKTGMTSPALSQLDGTVFDTSDGEAPDPPSAPVVTVRNGVAEIYYDGTDDAGAVPVWDLSHVELHIGVEENFPTTDLTFHSALSNAGAVTVNFPEYDPVTYYAKFIAVDRGGDRSAPSEEVVIRVPKVTSDDIQPGAVGTDQLSDDLEIGTDGNPPAAAPTNVRTQGANGLIFVLWDHVANADPVAYNVYGSDTTGFTADATTLLTPDGATSPISFHHLPDGIPFEYFVLDPITGLATEEKRPYFFRVEVRDADVADGVLGPISGEVSGSMDQTQEKDVAFGSIIGQHFSGEVIYGGTIGNAAEGAGWRGSAEAFGVYKSDGSAKFFAPTSDEPILINGQIIAQILDSYKLSVFGEENSYMPGSKTYLRGTTQGPATQPSVTSDNWSLQTLDEDEFPDKKRGFYYDAGTDRYFFCVSFGAFGSSIEEIDRNGVHIAGYTIRDAGGNPIDASGGLTKIGTTWYVLAYDVGDELWRVFRYSSLSIGNNDAAGSWNYSDTNNLTQPAIGQKDGNILTARTWASDGKIRIAEWNPTTGAQIGSTIVSNVAPGNVKLTAVLYGSFDLGVNRYIVAGRAHSDHEFWSVSSTGTSPANERWPIANDATLCGLVWDGTKFFHLSEGTGGGAPGHIIEYSTIYWTTQPDQWYIKNTLWDDDPLGTGLHETLASPPRKITMTKRGKMHVTTGGIPALTGSPDDAKGVRIYVGRTDIGVPPDNEMYLAPDQPASGETFVKIDEMNFAAADTLATKDPNFPEGDPAEFFDELEQKLLSSDGSIGVFYTGDLKGVTYTVAGSGTVIDGGWVWMDGTDVSIFFPFNKLWAKWGSPAPAGGAPANTFRLTNTKGRMPWGAGTWLAVRGTKGNADGDPTHTHPISSGGGHSHGAMSQAPVARTATGQDTAGSGHTHPSAGDHNHGGDTGVSADGAMPVFGVNWLVKL